MAILLNSENFLILLKLIAAHIIADFVLYKNLWDEKNNKDILSSWRLYLHSFIAAIITYILVWDFKAWWILPLMFFTHVGFDGLNARFGCKLIYFLIDQICHLIIILLSWIWLSNLEFSNIYHLFIKIFANVKIWIFIITYALVIWPGGILIGKITEPWRKDIEKIFSNGLNKAGLWIGRLERILVLTFIFIKYYEAIGFLIAAKSILRYGELNKTNEENIKSVDIQKKTEYILIGTMLSFMLGIAIGLLANLLLEKV